MTSPSSDEKAPALTAESVRQAMHAVVAMAAAGPREHHSRHPAVAYCYALGVLIAACLFAACVLLGPTTLGIYAACAPAVRHLSAATFVTAVIVAVQKLANVVINRKTLDDNVTFFNLRLVVRLLAGVLVWLVFLSAISQTWYTIPVVCGMFTILTGFAVQMPMTSFIGWLYILSRRPYRVGDRIKIAGATGDVIDVSYFDTTLWEFGGQYLSTDHPSGRVIKFPNATVLSTPVYNYSWALTAPGRCFLTSGTRSGCMSHMTAILISCPMSC